MRPKLVPAITEDAPAIFALRSAASDDLTKRFGQGPWSAVGTVQGVHFAFRNSFVFVAKYRGEVVATLTLATKKPWSIDRSYFSKVKRPLYLLAMAVSPTVQRQGLGRLCLEQAREIARDWPADALLLDAYEAPGGAGGFYAKCGFREVGRVTYRGVPLIYFEDLVSPKTGLA